MHPPPAPRSEAPKLLSVCRDDIQVGWQCSAVEDGSCAKGRAGGTKRSGGVGGGGGSSTWPEAQDKHGLEVRVVRRQCLGAQAVWAYDH